MRPLSRRPRLWFLPRLTSHGSLTAMDRRALLNRSALAAAAATTLAAPASAQALPQLRWRLTSSYPKTLDAIFGAGEVFARVVGELTDGRFHISVHGPGEVVPPLQALDAVQAGTVEACHSTASFYTGKSPAFAFATGVPFGLDTRQQSAWMLEGGGIELMNELFARFNTYGLPCGTTGAQMGGWYRKEIRSVADLQGLKMRIAGLGGTVLQRLGGVPQQLAGGDLYPALERGTIDAVEWLGPYDDEKLGFNKVAPFYYYPAWWEGAANTHLFINLAQWNALPASYKAAVRTAANEATSWMVARYDTRNPAALRRLIAAGTTLRPFPREVMEACHAEALKLEQELAAQHADYKRIHDEWSRQREDMRAWFGVAELSFDSFVIGASRRR